MLLTNETKPCARKKPFPLTRLTLNAGMTPKTVKSRIGSSALFTLSKFKGLKGLKGPRNARGSWADTKWTDPMRNITEAVLKATLAILFDLDFTLCPTMPAIFTKVDRCNQMIVEVSLSLLLPMNKLHSPEYSIVLRFSRVWTGLYFARD